MLNNANFLCEIGTEEIPAGYLPPAIFYIESNIREKLDELRLDHNEIRAYATPRRIILMVSGLGDLQRSETAEIKGPSAKSAYDPSGKPTKALQGFLQGNDLKQEEVYIHDTGKGEYVFAKKNLESKKTEEIIPGLVSHMVSTIPFPKRMKWSNKSVTFPRPIRYFLVMFNDRPVDVEIDGIKSGVKTRGHYILSNKYHEIKKISEYETVLNKADVFADQENRKEIIRRELLSTAEKEGFKLIDDEELLDTVTFLVEKPHIVACAFEKSFLEIPDVVLIAEMKVHQKYFAVTDASGKLVNRFLVVSNNPPTDYVIAGNQRVIAARFNDARFFYTQDRKQKLGVRIEGLKNILFHKELGTVYDKVIRMQAVAKEVTLALKSPEADRKKIERAIYLSKTDLSTALVIEFASLQGKIGKIYAMQDGEDRDVASAIEDHYRPRFQGDALPENIVSVVVSISEKIDNIFGAYSVGNIPKGSQDPYALRRQANAIVDILINRDIRLNLRDVLKAVSGNYKDGSGLVDKIMEFINARAKTIFLDSGFSHDEIDACLSIDSGDYLEMYRRARSLNEFRNDENFSRMLLSFKRMNNIVWAFRKDNAGYALAFDPKIMEEPEEKALFDFFNSKKAKISEYISSSKYIDLFKLLIEGKAIIDGFFDKVLVMDKKIEIRDNRLALLENILLNFKSLIDFSKIADR